MRECFSTSKFMTGIGSRYLPYFTLIFHLFIIQAVKVSDKNLAGLVPSPELQEW